MDYIKIGLRSYMIILFTSTLPFIEGSNINCNGKAFHCVNSTHFKICVDLGGGVSTTVDEFLIPCPQNTVCKPYNLFECEYELMTTLSPVTIQSEVTNEQFQTSDSSVSEKLDITTLFPMKQLQGLELSEKYYDKVNATPASYTRSFLTDAIISPVTASNSNGLHSDSDIDKKKNVTSSTDKELRFSTIESGINVTQTLPYNINTSVTGINHNIKSPIFFSITNDTKTLYSIKNESLEPLNKNSLDLDPTLAVTKITDQVSNLSELRYTAPVTLLPDNISEFSLQENTLRISNINSVINSENTSQEPNLDLLITHSTTQLINSDNNTEYHNTDIKMLNSTTLNVITDKIFTSDESDINNKAKVNSAITFESLGQHLAEITTASTIKVSGTTNQFIADKFLNEADATEVFLNDGLNITTNLEKLSVTDRDIIIPTTIQPGTSAVKINEMSSQITNSGFNYDVSSVILPSNISLFTTAVTKFAVNDKIIVGDYSYINDNMLPVFTTTEISNGVTNLKSIPNLISKNETWPKPVMAPVATDLNSNNKTTTEVSNNVTAEIIEGVTNLKSMPDFVSKNETQSKPILVTAATDFDKNNITTTEVSSNITAEISNGVTNLKSIPDLIWKNETLLKPVTTAVLTDFDSNNITTTEASNNITAEISDGVTSLKSMPDFVSKNETRSKPILVTAATDFDKNNITTTEVSSNITAEISNGVTNLKSIPDLIWKNETWPKPVMAAVTTGLDSNNKTTAEVSNNITAEIIEGVTNLKSIPDLISKNKTWPKPVMAAVATDLDSNYKTTAEISNNITAEINEGVTNLKPIADFFSKNETRSKPILVTVATDLDKNNMTTTEVSNNLTTKIFNGITSLQSIPNSISENEILLKPVMTAVATNFDSNDITTTEISNNITAAISNGDTSLKSIPNLISKNETWPKPVMAPVATDLNSNNKTTTEVSNNVTAEIIEGVTNLKSMPDFVSKNETQSKPILVTAATDFDKNNITTTEVSNNITAEISIGNTSLNSIPDLISKNETWPKPVMAAVTTDLDSNNKTSTEVSNNIIEEIIEGVTNLKSIPDFVSKNETRLKPILVTAATDLDKNNITTTEVSNNRTTKIFNGITSLQSIPNSISKNEILLKPVVTAVATDFDSNDITTTEVSNNITAPIPNGDTSLKSIPDLISKNETWPKPVMAVVGTDIDSNNITTIEASNNIADIDFDKNNITTIEVSNNITAKIFNGIASLQSIPNAIWKNETLLKPVMVVVATDLGSNNKTTTEVSNNITPAIFNGDTSLKSIPNSISKNETWTKPILATVPTDFDINNKTTTEVINNITEATHNNDSINPIINSLYKINKPLSVNSTLMNITLDVYQTITTNNTVYITANSMDVTNNTFTVIDVFSGNRSRTSKLESTVTAKPTTYFDADTTSKPVISLQKKITTMISEPVKKEIYTKQVIYENSSHKDQILDKYSFGNQNLTKRKTENILIPKLVTTNDTSLLSALNLNYTNKNITDKNILKDIQIKHTQVTNNLLKKSLTVDINNTDLNFTNKNIVSSVDSKFKSIPSVYLHSSFTKSPLPYINNVSHSYFSENMSPTRMFDKTNASNQYNETEDREPSKTNKNGLVPVNVISNIEREGNKTVYLNVNPYKQVTKPAIEVWAVANTTVGAIIKTFIHDRKVSEVKNLSVIKTKKNNNNAFHTTSKSNITANNLLRNMSSQTNSIKNKTRDAMPSSVLEFSRIPSKFYKSPQTTDLLKMDTTSLVLNTTKLEIITKPGENTISDHSNRSNGSEKKQIRNGNGSSQFIPTIGIGVTENLRNNTQNSFVAPIHNISYNAYGNPPTNQELSCTKRGKYSDTKNCHKFYVCLGRGKPIIGVCPTGTVFSEYIKQCTKNVTHCIRNNQFKCTAAGRFINILSNNSYFICAMKKSGFIRFTLHCQKGYYLDKNNVKCTPELKGISLISYENSSKITKELSFEPKEIEGVTANIKNVFECEKEGKFKDSQDCRKYYVCKKGRKSTFRRKIKKCDSDEVFHRKKKKCVDVESYECDI